MHHSNSTQILALKKMVFLKKIFFQKKIFIFFTFFQCNFSVRTLWRFQKNFEIFFDPQKVKKRASKVAHNRPNFFFHSPAQTTAHSRQPTAQNWFFIIWNFGTRHLFSYLWHWLPYILGTWNRVQIYESSIESHQFCLNDHHLSII